MLTTTIGSYPKPEFMTVPGFIAKHPNPTARYSEWLKTRTEEDLQRVVEGTKEIVSEQCTCGVDIPTDGEAPREHYIYYHLRQIKGYDFENLATRNMRGDSWQALVPCARQKIEAAGPFLAHDWKIAQSATKSPVKMTVPGPFTITGTTANEYYPDEKSLCMDLADALNVEIKRLAEAGCQYIQVDEPVFARKPELAMDWGFEAVERCFHGVPDSVTRVMHMCCGYPSKLNYDDYPKADRNAYFQLAEGIDSSSINALSIEDAHRHNDLSLLEKFKNTTILFGVVHIANTRVETVDEIRERLSQALEHIDADRLIAAPDCGLAMLPRELVVQKLKNMCEAAKSL